MNDEPKKNAAPGWLRRLAPLRRRAPLIVAGAVGIAAVAWLSLKRDDDGEDYRTARIDRGAITRVVSATGTLQPLVSANVGSTVSGPVREVLVDFNAQVRAGQVLARIDPASFEQRVVQAHATLAQAQAQLGVAEADYQRYVVLQQRGFASQQLMVQQGAARDSARAAVQQAEATLASARTDLDRSVIRSPIDGVVVDRQVNVGQSVAASLQAPTLFVIAQDLSRLQANIVVDEADIGDVREGMAVRFTVDAFPERDFEGRVSQVRQQGVAEQGVVSYTVVVEADNPGRQLLPGMTANAEIVLEERQNVLRAPNTALRFRPADPEVAARGQALTAGAPGGSGATPGAGEGGGGQGAGRGRALEQLTQTLELTPAQQETAREAFRAFMQSEQRPGPEANQSERRAFMRRGRERVLQALAPTLTQRQRERLAQMREGGGERAEVRRRAVVWVLRDGALTPALVEIGIADNGYTLVHSGLEEGDEVVIGGGPAARDQQRGPLGGPGVRIRGA